MTAGRKRAFDKQEALDKAMHVFWENGYAATSLSQLTAALGINKPSLYAAFGNKEELFASAMDHYMERYASPVLRHLTHPDDAPLDSRLKAYLEGIVDMVTDCDSPAGCMFVKTNCESSGVGTPAEIRRELDDMGLATDSAISAVLEAERVRGNLPSDTSIPTLTAFVLSIAYGLSVLAQRGKTRDELSRVIDMAIDSAPLLHQPATDH